MLCISTNFWVLHAPESWLKYFFESSLTFLFILIRKMQISLKTTVICPDSDIRSAISQKLLGPIIQNFQISKPPIINATK